MAWLIGIICVIIVVTFWRVFLPLGVIVAIVIGGFLFLDYRKDENRKEAQLRELKQEQRKDREEQEQRRVREEQEQRRIREEQERIRNMIAAAQKNAPSEGEGWVVYSKKDPASHANIARMAEIISTDGLCILTVQKRINGVQLTDLTCPDIHISTQDSIHVKFDFYETSKKLKLTKYGDSDDVYIPDDRLYDIDERLYEWFIHGLVTGNSVAIKVPSAGSFWVRFTLNGGTVAINQLGKPMPDNKEEWRINPARPTPPVHSCPDTLSPPLLLFCLKNQLGT